MRPAHRTLRRAGGIACAVAAEAWTLTEDLRIGRPEGEGPDVLWGIAGFGVGPGEFRDAMGIAFDPDGTVLVQLVTPASAGDSVFDVFDREGRLLGQVRTSVRLAEGFEDPPPQVHGDCIYGIAKDSLGVQYLLRYRITKPGEPTT